MPYCIQYFVWHRPRCEIPPAAPPRHARLSRPLPELPTATMPQSCSFLSCTAPIPIWMRMWSASPCKGTSRLKRQGSPIRSVTTWTPQPSLFNVYFLYILPGSRSRDLPPRLYSRCVTVTRGTGSGYGYAAMLGCSFIRGDVCTVIALHHSLLMLVCFSDNALCAL